jgi:hypothetical protein
MKTWFGLRLAPLLLVLSQIYGCNTQEGFVVSGTLSDFYSGMSIADAELQLSYTSLEGGTYSTNYKFLSETTTDANGQFRLEFDYVSAVDFRIRSIKNGYVGEEYFFDRDDWKVKEDNIAELTAFGESNLTVSLINNTSRSQYLLKLSEHSEGCTSCCSSGTYSIKNFVDTAFTCSMYANQRVNYEIINAELGDISKKTGSILIEPGTNYFQFDTSQ